MKHGKRPTRNQKKLISSARLQPDNWLVCKDTTTELVLENRFTGKSKIIRKELLK